MSETAILVLGHTPEAPVQWAFLGDDGVVDAGLAPSPAALSAVSERAVAARRVVAVVPGEDAASRTIAAPPKAASKFRAAAGYLLEDELAENLADLHVATALRGERGVVLAVKRSLMERWLAALKIAGIEPDVLTIDFVLLSTPDTDVIALTPERAVCAMEAGGFAAERPLADALVTRVVDESEAAEVVIYGDPANDVFDIAGENVEWRDLSPLTMFELFHDGLTRGSSINLLTGAFRKRRDWRGAAGAWRRAATLTAASVAGLFVLLGADAIRSGRVAQGYDARAQSVHDAAFPEAAGADPRAHARAILATEGDSGPGFLGLSAQFANAIDGAENIQIDRIRFNAARDEFIVSLRFSDINDLERLKSTLAARGVTTRETGSVRRSGEFYVGELQAAPS
ncbi:MAG: type II secretion system protein GspL [Pseudomonadota bacterium]